MFRPTLLPPSAALRRRPWRGRGVPAPAAPRPAPPRPAPLLRARSAGSTPPRSRLRARMERVGRRAAAPGPFGHFRRLAGAGRPLLTVQSTPGDGRPVTRRRCRRRHRRRRCRCAVVCAVSRRCAPGAGPVGVSECSAGVTCGRPGRSAREEVSVSAPRAGAEQWLESGRERCVGVRAVVVAETEWR